VRASHARAEALGIVRALLAALVVLVAARALGVAPRLAFGGAIAIDGPAVFLAWTVAIAGAWACAAAATSGRARHDAAATELALLAAASWVLAACTLDVACAAAAWAIGWALAAAAIAGGGGAERLEAGATVQAMGFAASVVLALAAGLAGGLAGSTHSLDIAQLLTSHGDAPVLARAVLRLLLVGLALAAAWVPFHQWAPDALGAAPRPVATVLAIAAPAAAAVALARAVGALEPALDSLAIQWRGGLFALAALTIVVAGSVALVQRDAARLVGYLSVVQGAELAAALTAPAGDAGALLPALATHAAALVPAWLALGAWSDGCGEPTAFEALRGRGRRRPFASALWIVALALLAGFPGGARDAARLPLLTALDAATALAVLLAISTALQWAAVVRLAGVLWLEPPPEAAGPRPAASPSAIASWTAAALALAAAVALAHRAPFGALGEVWRRFLAGG
jgi:NADH-quinone oxidoreductase subunit N